MVGIEERHIIKTTPDVYFSCDDSTHDRTVSLIVQVEFRVSVLQEQIVTESTFSLSDSLCVMGLCLILYHQGFTTPMFCQTSASARARITAQVYKSGVDRSNQLLIDRQYLSVFHHWISMRF